jgi:hypothetical protein
MSRTFNANGSITDTRLDANGQMIAQDTVITNSDGSSIFAWHDAQGNGYTNYYSAQGVLVRHDTPFGDGTTLSETFNANGSITDTHLDANGNIIAQETITTNSDGSMVIAWHDALGNSYTNYYNAQGALTQQVTPNGDGTFMNETFNANGSLTYTRLDVNGNILAQQTISYNRDGSSVVAWNDNLGDSTISYLNAQGVMTSQAIPSPSGTMTKVFNADGTISETFTSPSGAVLTVGTSTPNGDGTFTETVSDNFGNTGTVTVTAAGGAVQPGTYSSYLFHGANLSDPGLVAIATYDLPGIYAAYGLTAASNELARANALRDWVARTAVGNVAGPHPDGSTSDLSVLPAGATWAGVNDLITEQRETADVYYWSQFDSDGVAMVNALLGAQNLSTGVRDSSGMMQEIAPGEYQIKDLSTYHFLSCDEQARILQTLYAAAGFQSMSVLEPAHSVTAVYLPSLAKWVYEDPFYDEQLAIGSNAAASPAELFAASQAGGSSFQAIQSVKQLGPSWDPTYYTGLSFTYFNTNATPLMTYLVVWLQDTLQPQYFNRIVDVSGQAASPDSSLPVLDAATVFAAPAASYP